MMLDRLFAEIPSLPAPYPKHVVFVSATDGQARARVVTVTANTLAELREKLNDKALQSKMNASYLRFDWVETVSSMTFGAYETALREVKRNFSRKGLSFDPDFRRAVTEGELNASALLYKGAKVPHCEVNHNNFDVYWTRRFGQKLSLPAPEDTVYLFTSAGLFCDQADGIVHPLLPTGPNTGRRDFDMNDAAQLEALITQGADYLAGEVNADGTFNYGWHPSFDRPINHYNTLRHASSTYALCEAYELLQKPMLRDAIERSLAYLSSERIIFPDGPSGPAFLTDLNNEVKLGGNAVAILAMCKFTEVTGDKRYLDLARQLGDGILTMEQEDGSFSHVLYADSLDLKEARRKVYCDGESAFALMRLYKATGDDRWIDTVRRAMKRYIAAEYWKYNDHWLAYCAAELVLHDPDPDYIRFGVRNLENYLDFIATRRTTFPTLLELCCASRLLIRQALSDPALEPSLEGLDLQEFVGAMETRAQYLANGFFFPEVAMHFRNPARIVGSFFIRHHGFRVRIDDVEHYLSGLIAYRTYLNERDNFSKLVRGAGSDLNPLNGPPSSQ